MLLEAQNKTQGMSATLVYWRGWVSVCCGLASGLAVIFGVKRAR